MDPSGFWKDTVDVYFRNPPHPSILIHTSLNLNTLYFVFTRSDLPVIIAWGLILIIFLVTVFKKARSDQYIFRFTIFLFSVFVLGRQGFINYFYLIASLIILQISITVDKQ